MFNIKLGQKIRIKNDKKYTFIINDYLDNQRPILITSTRFRM